jgi:hypothetical protein
MNGYGSSTGYQPPQNNYVNYGYQPPTTDYAQQSQINGLMVVLVETEDEVNYYPVAAGYTVMLVSFKLGKFWLKSTSKNGIPEPLRVFDFSEVVIEPQVQESGNYATKAEMLAISEKLDKLISNLGGDK